MQYAVSETENMVANGVAVMTQNGSATWATCLGCAIMEGSRKSLPAACGACFKEHCFKQSIGLVRCIDGLVLGYSCSLTFVMC